MASLNEIMIVAGREVDDHVQVAEVDIEQARNLQAESCSSHFWTQDTDSGRSIKKFG